jgi:ABC-2 type transport system ATP-binding protein
METMIQIEKLAKRYGSVRALNGLDMQVGAGMVYGFLGPNGAGKTTTLRILAGLARADQGHAWIMGEPVSLHALGQRPVMGVLPEEPAFYPWMTPREYLRDFIAPLYRLDAKEAARRTNELLGRVSLDKAANRRIGGFSRGMRQRLGLAQALIHQPSILLMDEPVSALDPAGRREVLELIENLHGQATILLSTHILADVERVCDTVGIINKGRMVLESDRQALLDRYALPFFEIEVENSPGDGHSQSDWVAQLGQMPFVDAVQTEGRVVRVGVKDIHLAQRELLTSLAQNGLLIRRFEITTPSLEDIFLKLTDDTQPGKVQGG